MSRRVSKFIAQTAAETMSCLAYKDKIEQVELEKKNYADKLVQKYIPVSILTTVLAYPSYFSTCQHISITAPKETTVGYGYNCDYITCEIKRPLPTSCRYLKVQKEEYDILNRLELKRKRYEMEQKEMAERLVAALVALKTDVKIKERLPEAMPYLNFPELPQLPAPVYTDLREMLKAIKK